MISSAHMVQFHSIRDEKLASEYIEHELTKKASSLSDLKENQHFSISEARKVILERNEKFNELAKTPLIGIRIILKNLVKHIRRSSVGLSGIDPD